MPDRVRVNVKLATYFFSPSLHSVIALGHQLLVEEAVEKMNLTEESKKQTNKHCSQTCTCRKHRLDC